MILTLEEKRRLRVAVWYRDKGRCRYCGTACHWNSEPYDSFDDDFAILEHVIPRSKGGTWDIENLVLACNYCNAKKAFLNGEKLYYKSDNFAVQNIERFMRIAGIQL